MDEPIRIGSIIDQLDYSSLVERDVLPDLRPMITTGTKRYPRWVYQELKGLIGEKCFPCFGLFVDCIIRKMISQVIPVDWGLFDPFVKDTNQTWKEIAYPTFCRVLQQYSDTGYISKDVFNKTFPLLQKMATTFQAAFQTSQDHQVAFNQEYVHQIVAGHPDIVTSNSVIDIKTVTSFKSQAERHFLQILSYTALMRIAGHPVDYAGILLSMQGELLMADLHEWDSNNYLKVLLERAIVIQDSRQDILCPANGLIAVGSTIARTIRSTGKTLSLKDTLQKYIQQTGGSIPCQLFLHGNHGTFLHFADEEIVGVRTLIDNFELPVYIHAPYCINPSKPWTYKNPNDETWALQLLSKHLETSRVMGFLGVVVHTGKAIDMTIEDGLNRMENSLRSVLGAASDKTVLMLETPVGAGNELCHKIEDLSAFYSRFSSSEHQKFKICIDTCHVFVAGYDPMEYLLEWEKLQGADSIGLIHFNDSRKKFGCRADGHAMFGTGNIGARKLSQVSEWCRARNIHMVTE